MPFDINLAIRQDAKRRAGKPELVIPNLTFRAGPITTPREDSAALLAACGKVIASTGLLYCWKRYTGKVVLVQWQGDRFTGFDNSSFGTWLGAHFDLRNQSGMHFGVACAAVTIASGRNV